MVKEELLINGKGVALVKLVDRTFNANRDYARKLWQYLMEVDSSTCFHLEISADLTDEDIELLSSVPKEDFNLK